MGEIQPLDYSMLLNAGRTFNPMQVYLQAQQGKGMQSENRLRDLQTQSLEQSIPLDKRAKELQIKQAETEFDHTGNMRTLGAVATATGKLMSEYTDMRQSGMSDMQARSTMQPKYQAIMGQLQQMGILSPEAMSKVPQGFDPNYLTQAHNLAVPAAQRLEAALKNAELKKTEAETADTLGKGAEKQKDRENAIELEKMKNRNNLELERIKSNINNGKLPTPDNVIAGIMMKLNSGAALSAGERHNWDQYRMGKYIGGSVQSGMFNPKIPEQLDKALPQVPGAQPVAAGKTIRFNLATGRLE